MSTPQETECFVNGRLAPSGGRKLAFVDWGAAGNERVAVCVHGLTRNSRDFDWLAASLSATHRVLAVDVAGRGRSEWLEQPSGYAIETYIGDIFELLADLGIGEVDWIGTSMGGIMGIAVAGHEDEAVRGAIRRLVLNDIGPFLPSAPMTQLAQRVGRAPLFPDMAAVEAYQHEVCAEWGDLPADRWAHLAEHSVREVEAGGFAYHHDPRIGDVVRAKSPVPDLDIWPVWDRITCPVMLLRGAESAILPADVADEMTRRGPGAERIDYPGIGHTPSMMVEDQIAAVTGGLNA